MAQLILNSLSICRKSVKFTLIMYIITALQGRFSPEEYEPLAAMRKLSLAHNELHSLHQDLFEHLPELTELDLSGNPLATIDHVTLIAISSLPMLKVLTETAVQNY